ncbi:2-methylaconitate cis-trans isomerase PrpF family protein [Hydrogenophaga sp. BPS33]|uniref:2-methylaconitate cis-trans isomerase PrpF family protein n=1 Tax=Hydrogenophaga sp. BPS33 TaxID=2651974 RepID=UPI00131F49E3|nr:PrpF domain-containing protein [Hydrogenophaga sp. BPS33]QHE89328.1 PrpF family protein [Hydrogenophaga sp. BPS33]
MRQTKLPAVFVRAGTSKGLLFHARDLPADRARWDALVLGAMGSPDPYGRQLDGMGGGLSSLSKVCVIGPPSRPDADVDYTFGQVQIKTAQVDWQPLCGNMSAAIGPFAVDEGLVRVPDGPAVVRIHNTNTGKLIVAHFEVRDGVAEVDGDLEIPGVAGTGSPLRLDFLDPGGASTGQLLPTGNVVDTLQVPGVGAIEASLVDASNACVFVRAADVGLTGTESPTQLEDDSALMHRLSAIRIEASLRMGLAADAEEAARRTAVPFIAVVAPPTDSVTLSGDAVPAASVDLLARALSNGQPHRALPLGVSMCMATAARIGGSVVNQVCAVAAREGGGPLRIGMPSGVLQVAADVKQLEGDRWHVESGGFYRTQRRLFEGTLLVRGLGV